MNSRSDIFIIGGGPAGLSAAIAARQRGFDVIVADGARPPVDKPCGEGLMPDGREALASLGIQIPKRESYPFRGIKFVSGGISVDASFPRQSGLGVRRTALHCAMIQRAESCGVSLLWQTPVTGVRKEGVQLGKQFVRSHWIIGADGGNSLVRRWIGLDGASALTRYAFRRHYRLAPWSDYMELHWGPKCQIYITPVAADEICVALVSRDPHLRLDAALRLFPEIAARLNGADVSSAERGAISSTRRLRQIYRGKVALVGDASGAVDSITGEGLCLTFQQSQLLAECLIDGDLRRYQKEHARLGRRPAMMARLLLTLDWKSSLRQRVMQAFDSDPRLFTRMLSMHVGDLSARAFAGNAVSLGWKMLTV